jgi:nucleoside-diphosphate-sugar epimerase
MKILVTGGAGYCGIPLCELLLNEGHEVTIFDNFLFGCQSVLHLVNHPRLHVVRGDIRAERITCLADKDVVFHLAGISGYPACEANPAGARLINIDGTANIVRKLSKEQLFINASTTSFYGKGISSETDPIKPINLYGESKKAAEDICMQRENSISLRWATVFGPSARMRDDLMVNDFVRRAMRERTLVLYDPDSTRTFIHISDLAKGYLFAMNNAAHMRGGVYNMGTSGLNFTKRKIANLVSSVVQCEIIIAQTGDKDVRDFLVQFDKVEALGFECESTMLKGINQLVKLYQFYDSQGTVI